jgi:hypothetical protein
MNTTTRTIARRAAATTAVLAGAAVLVAAPAFASIPPEDAGADPAASQTNKAQVEHAERTSPVGGVSAQTKAQVEHLEQAMRDQQRAEVAAPESPSAPYAAQQRAYLDGLTRAGQVTAPEPAARSAMSAQQLAYAKHLELAAEAARVDVASGQVAAATSDPSSVPVTVLTLFGGALVAGAAGFTVYRFRHHGPMGAATA